DMKLPKNFGGQGFGGMMKQMQDAMARAQTLEEELKQERIGVDKGPVKAIFDGTGEIQKISIDPSVVDPDDVEMLEDMIVSVVREGFEASTQLRNNKVQGIMPNLPEIPGM
ncbi:MAG TPA: YbaB/EbfC family nucleoid-associated protein, partial [Fimbriimonas sp.]|nr:YbaB/EbfC family nucleoid-associated protein [Fimbriimonas sp.]